MDNKSLKPEEAGLASLGEHLDSALAQWDIPNEAPPAAPPTPPEQPPTPPVEDAAPPPVAEPEAQPPEEQPPPAEGTEPPPAAEPEITEDDEEDAKSHFSPHDSPSIKKRLAKINRKHKEELARREQEWTTKLQERERIASEAAAKAKELEAKVSGGDKPTEGYDPEYVAQLRWLHEAEKTPEIQKIQSQIKSAEAAAYNVLKLAFPNAESVKAFENGGLAEYVTSNYSDIKGVIDRIAKEGADKNKNELILASAKLSNAVSQILTLKDEKDQKIQDGRTTAKQYFEAQTKQPEEQRTKASQERTAYLEKARPEISSKFEWFKKQEIKPDAPEKERQAIESYNKIVEERIKLFENIMTKEDFTPEERHNIGAYVNAAHYFQTAANTLTEENKALKAELEKMKKARTVAPRPSAIDRPPIESPKKSPTIIQHGADVDADIEAFMASQAKA